MKQANGTPNVFTSAAAPTLEASWTPLLAASDGTKAVVSPFVQAPTAEAGAARTFGGGNETLGGIETVIGREPTTFTAMVRGAKQATIKAMKALQCEDGNLGVFLVNEFGQIAAIKGGTTQAPTWSPIPVRSFFVGDKTFGGLEAPDSNMVQFTFPPNYSDNIDVVTPTDFNPLNDL